MEKPKKANSRVLLYVAMPGEEKKKSLLRLRIFDSSPKIIQEEETSRSRGNGRPCCRRLPEDHANADAEIRTVCHTHMVEAGACTLHNLGRIVVYLSNLRASNASSHSSRLFQFLPVSSSHFKSLQVISRHFKSRYVCSSLFKTLQVF